MSALLHRLGVWAAHRAGRVMAAWGALLAALAILVASIGVHFVESFHIKGAESLQGMSILQERLPQAAGTNEPVLFSSEDSDIVAHQNVVQEFIDRASAIDGVAMVMDPFSELSRNISDDGKHALLQVMGDKSVGSQLTGPTPKSTDTARELRALVDDLATTHPDVKIHMGGNIGHFITVEMSITEVIGVIVAGIVLLATFGSLLAAGAPLLTALIGVGIGMLGIAALTRLVSINSTTPVLAVMIGLAVGIDYALFIIARAREYLVQGIEPAEAAGRANATAGSAVVFAGGTVIVALCGLTVTGIPFLAVMGVAAAAIVALAVAIAITAVPALLGAMGLRALSKRQLASLSSTHANVADSQLASSDLLTSAQPIGEPEEIGGYGRGEAVTSSPARQAHHAEAIPKRGLAHRWVHFITHAPAVTVLVVTALLGMATLPAMSMTTGLTDNGSEPVGTPLRTTFDAIGDAFGDGYNAPIVVIGDIVHSQQPLELVADLKQQIRKIPGVRTVLVATPNPDASLAFVQVVPEHGQTHPATTRLVQDLRTNADSWEKNLGIKNIMVTGGSAVAIDIADTLNNALLPFGLVVVGLSVILLLIVFRSVAVPLTATIGYLLSLGAAFGSVGLVYGWGWGAELLHVSRTGAVISFMPVIVMGILFGLAMDYQVFLVSRIREEWIHSGNALSAVREGFIGSATVVSTAAIIMTAVFAAFVPEGSVQVKPIALALTAGIAADAFLVRMTLIPAVMAWLGKSAWWIPSWLDRSLPVVDVEGEGLLRALEHQNWVAEHGTSTLRLHNVEVRDAKGVVIPPLSFHLSRGQLGIIRSGQILQRRALTSLLTARLRATSGVLVIGNNVLPDGTMASQGLTAMMEHWNDVYPARTRIIIADDPGERRWNRIHRLLEQGHTVVVTTDPSMVLPPHLKTYCTVDVTLEKVPTVLASRLQGEM